MVTRSAWSIVAILLAMALCRGLSLPVGCGAFSLDCFQLFLVVVLDLMTRPRRRPFFLYVNAFCFPREGRLHQYPLLRLFWPVRMPCLLLVGVNCLHLWLIQAKPIHRHCLRRCCGFHCRGSLQCSNLGYISPMCVSKGLFNGNLNSKQPCR
jgi:hypothetical protein